MTRAVEHTCGCVQERELFSWDHFRKVKVPIIDISSMSPPEAIRKVFEKRIAEAVRYWEGRTCTKCYRMIQK